MNHPTHPRGRRRHRPHRRAHPTTRGPTLARSGRPARPGRAARAAPDLGCATTPTPFGRLRTRCREVLSRGAPSGRNIGIVTAYNDMLSAHAPFAALSRDRSRTRPRAGRRPRPRSRAACRPCATASPRAARAWSCRLFSRDVIAMATAVALSHDMFDARADARRLRQDRARPADRRAALRPPADRLRARRPDALRPVEQREGHRCASRPPQGKVGREELLEAEIGAYHAPGTCTFYGTANTNQMLIEAMGLHLPGATFVNPGTPLREALTREARAPRWPIARRALHADRRARRRARDRQRHRRAAGHRRLDQPH